MSIVESQIYPTPILLGKAVPSFVTPSEIDRQVKTEQLFITPQGIDLRCLPEISEMTGQILEMAQTSPKQEIFAMDLGDEIRNIQSLINQGRNPNEYWTFFRDQAEYYANETYGKVKDVCYSHDLVRENGELRLWIDSLGKTARSSYGQAYSEASKPWYKERCLKEASGIVQLEELIEKYNGEKIVVEVSPAPFDVSKEEMSGANFGTHSFIRLHEVRNGESGAPYLLSHAIRVQLPPHSLVEAYEALTGEEFTRFEDLLGRCSTLRPDLSRTSITNRSTLVAVHRLIKSLEEKSPQYFQEKDIPEASLEEMKNHHRVLEPYLMKVFKDIVNGIDFGDSQNVLVGRAIRTFQNWEKMLQGRLDGTWEKVEKEYLTRTTQTHQGGIDPSLVNYFESMQYIPQENSCGGGSGGAGQLSFSNPSAQILIGKTDIISGLMNYEGLSGVYPSKSSEECVTCPHCQNEKGNKKKDGKYICGNRACPSNKKK